MRRYLCLYFIITACTLSTSEACLAKVLHSYGDVAARILPSVVNIRTTDRISQSDKSLDPYAFFLQDNNPSPQGEKSLGSGIIIDTKGHILTNYHVISKAKRIDVLFSDSKTKVKAKVIGTDPSSDLALLKINVRMKLKPADFGNSDKIRVGDAVLAVGNPFGYSHTVTSGIISAKGRVIGQGAYDDFLQTDASIHPGNSGGPLVDMRSRVIGINTSVSSQGHGIGFALPSNLARKIIKDLIKHGKVIKPFLGIVGKNILSRDELDSSFNPKGIYGVLISNLIVDGPGHKAGLKIGDLLMKIDGKKVENLNSLQMRLAAKKPKDNLSLQVYRRAKGRVTIKAQLEETPTASDLPTSKGLF